MHNVRWLSDLKPISRITEIEIHLLIQYSNKRLNDLLRRNSIAKSTLGYSNANCTNAAPPNKDNLNLDKVYEANIVAL